MNAWLSSLFVRQISQRIGVENMRIRCIFGVFFQLPLDLLDDVSRISPYMNSIILHFSIYSFLCSLFPYFSAFRLISDSRSWSLRTHLPNQNADFISDAYSQKLVPGGNHILVSAALQLYKGMYPTG